MKNVFMCFNMHQPHRLVKYSVFNIGHNQDYFLDQREVIEVLAKTCYIPGLKLMLDLLNKNENYKFALSVSGSSLELFEKYTPNVIDLIKKLFKTGRVELISCTNNNTLSSIYSLNEFERQIKNNNKILKKYFKIEPKIFLNTYGIYDSKLAEIILRNGFKYAVVDGRLLNKESNDNGLILIPYNYDLSYNIIQNFSNKHYKDYPITAEKYMEWLNSSHNSNLLFDFEVLGEIHRADSGIFRFFEALPKKILSENQFVSSDYFSNLNLENSYKISYGDFNFLYNELLNNKMQKEIFNHISLYPYDDLKEEILNDLSRLQDITHLKNMATNNFNKHSPYELFISYMNILKDLNIRLDKKTVIIQKV